jgi:quinol monooxygenase YgiN
MSEQLTLVAMLKAKPGRSEELGSRLKALIEPTRAEAGNIDYLLHRATDGDDTWMLYENWRSKRDLDLHFETSYLKDFLKAAPTLLANEMDLRFFQQTT